MRLNRLGQVHGGISSLNIRPCSTRFGQRSSLSTQPLQQPFHNSAEAPPSCEHFVGHSLLSQHTITGISSSEMSHTLSFDHPSLVRSTKPPHSGE